jgi:tetratricopeptide (TPR) repeat protein
MQLATDLGARDLSNLEMGAYYVEAGAWLVPSLVNMGRNDEARRRGEDAVALADKVLEQRPGYRLALHGQQVIEGSLSNVAQNELNPTEAFRLGLRMEQISFTLLKLDPDNIVTANNLGVAHQTLGDSLWGAGKLAAAIPYYQKSLDDYARATTAYRQAQLGDAAGAAATIAANAPFLAKLRQKEPQASVAPVLVDALVETGAAAAAYERDDYVSNRRIAAAAADLLRSITPHGDLEVSQRSISLFFAQHLAARAAYQMGNYASAETDEREALTARKIWGTEAIPDQRDLGEVSTWLAMALAHQGKRAEAAELIAPVVKFQRALAARNRGDVWLPLELASALYAQALADPKARATLLHEAATLLDAMPATLRNIHDVRQWRERISVARGAG